MVMETVKEFRKLLDDRLTGSRSNQMSSRNFCSKVANEARISTESRQGKMNCAESEMKFRNQDHAAMIMRDLKNNTGTGNRKPFLRKGDGLKRFQPTSNQMQRRTCCPLRNQKTDNRAMVTMPTKSTEPKTLYSVTSSTTTTESYEESEEEEEEEEEDPIIKETNEQILALEQRILNLINLKDSVCQLDYIQKNEMMANKKKEEKISDLNRLAETMENVQEKLSAMNRRLEVLSTGGKEIYNEKKSYQAKNEMNTSKCQDPKILTLPNGVEKLIYPNGDIEIRTNTYVKRKYACGKVKTRYSNGCEEIVYGDGRLQFKNQFGKIVFDRIIDDDQ